MPSIKQLQAQLPWLDHYNKNFADSPVEHKDFAHALLHIQKAAGKLAAVVDEADHIVSVDSEGSALKTDEIDPYIADLIICALRMANTCPGRVIDLEAAVVERLEKKNKIKLKFDNPPQKKYTLLQVVDEAVEEFWKIFNGK